MRQGLGAGPEGFAAEAVMCLCLALHPPLSTGVDTGGGSAGEPGVRGYAAKGRAQGAGSRRRVVPPRERHPAQGPGPKTAAFVMMNPRLESSSRRPSPPARQPACYTDIVVTRLCA